MVLQHCLVVRYWEVTFVFFLCNSVLANSELVGGSHCFLRVEIVGLENRNNNKILPFKA
jgi:hypothetical protein